MAALSWRGKRAQGTGTDGRLRPSNVPPFEREGNLMITQPITLAVAALLVGVVACLDMAERAHRTAGHD